jgi:5-methyltetrahydropteroyltriglutamate--homocysteine methyltransferase
MPQQPLLATTIVGSYPQPDWLVDRSLLAKGVPRVVGRIARTRPVELRAMEFLRRHTQRPAKITLPGPFTLAQQARNEAYRDVEELAMDFAAAVNAEARDLERAGADVIQLDEPWLRNAPEAAGRFAVPAINRALEGLTVTTAIHLCFGYAAVVRHQKPTGYSFLPQLAATTAAQISIEAAQPRLDLGVLADLAGKTIILGVIDLGDPTVETPERVAARLRAGLQRVPAARLVAAPDCGMKYLPRDVAFGKLAALSAGAGIVRAEV